ncbi:MAG TPA: ubiquinol-cytochrome C chaperone family protein [Azospirillum sp.]|nr:ubiquinol-cytochrome C chaperone family protein [Azospirillum sp.]
MLDRLFGRSRDRRAAFDLYSRIIGQARRPEFYAQLGVPDTLDGRFDMVALHLFLVMHRLKGQGDAADARSRRLFEVVTADFERSLRELGAGDQGISRRVTAMVGGVKGRLMAYDAALAGDDRALEVALDNNLYGTVLEPDAGNLAAMAAYVRRESASLAAQPLDALLAGDVRFGEPPGN